MTEASTYEASTRLARRIAQCENKEEVLREVGIRNDSRFEEATKLYRAVFTTIQLTWNCAIWHSCAQQYRALIDMKSNDSSFALHADSLLPPPIVTSIQLHECEVKIIHPPFLLFMHVP
jgi:hypothetical protein